MASDLVPLRDAILAVRPDLAGAVFRSLPGGWHSRAVVADARFVFKFPQGADAERALQREATILAALRWNRAVTPMMRAMLADWGRTLFTRPVEA